MLFAPMTGGALTARFETALQINWPGPSTSACDVSVGHAPSMGHGAFACSPFVEPQSARSPPPPAPPPPPLPDGIEQPSTPLHAFGSIAALTHRPAAHVSSAVAQTTPRQRSSMPTFTV